MPLYYESKFGAANRVRTGDVLLGKQVLYQLSYSRNMMVPHDRIELP